MTNVLHRRKMAWAFALWSGYVATWAVITGSGPAIVTFWWLAGVIVFGALWLGTQPLFERRHRATSFIVPHRASEVRRDAR